MDAMVVHCSVVGSHISAASTPVVETRLVWSAPPTANTFPSGSSTRLCWERANAIGAGCRQVGDGWLRSITPVVVRTGSVSLGGLPPLASSTLPGRYMAEVPNENGETPRLVQVCVLTSSVRDCPSAPAAIKILPFGSK